MTSYCPFSGRNGRPSNKSNYGDDNTFENKNVDIKYSANYAQSQKVVTLNYVKL